MIRNIICLFGLWVTIAHSVLAQNSEIDSLKLDWVEYKLSNGLQIVLQQDTSRQDIAIEWWLHTGSSHESPDQYGLAHFFEHATPYGLSGDREPQKVLMDSMRFSNAQTRPDFIRYYMQIKPEVFELGLRYVSDRMKADSVEITDRWVEAHRKNVLREYDRQASNPFWGGKQREMRSGGTFGENHPYGHSGYGTRQNNENFVAQDLRKFFTQNVFVGNITLFIVGNFKVNETKDLVEKYFSDIHSGGKKKSLATIPVKHSSTKEKIKIHANSHTLIMSWALPEWGDEDDPALRLISEIMNQRLAEISGETPLTTEAGCSVFIYQLAGEMIVYATFSKKENFEEIEDKILRLVQKIFQMGVSADEISSARFAQINEVKSRIEKEQLGFISSRIEYLGEGLLYKNNPGYYITRLEKQQEISSSSVQEVTMRWLKKLPYRLHVIGIGEKDK